MVGEEVRLTLNKWIPPIGFWLSLLDSKLALTTLASGMRYSAGPAPRSHGTRQLHSRCASPHLLYFGHRVWGVTSTTIPPAAGGLPKGSLHSPDKDDGIENIPRCKWMRIIFLPLWKMNLWKMKWAFLIGFKKMKFSEILSDWFV